MLISIKELYTPNEKLFTKQVIKLIIGYVYKILNIKQWKKFKNIMKRYNINIYVYINIYD